MNSMASERRLAAVRRNELALRYVWPRYAQPDFAARQPISKHKLSKEAQLLR